MFNLESKELILKLVKVICITIGFVAFCLAMAWVFSPDVIMTFRIESDNNTLEMVRSINYTYLK